MLRLPTFSVARPESLGEAVALLAAHGDRASVVAGGTDLLPNLKHRIVDFDVLVALGRIPELSGVRVESDGSLVIGAMTPLDRVAGNADVQERAPVLAQAAGIVASPQIRHMGTLGGNVMLDTRCRYINQTHFWRKSLGYCLKKDGTLCHVVAGGRKCVAAASNDTAPALMTLGGLLELTSASGSRRVHIDDFWHTDGIYNKKTAPGEILVSVRIPPQRPGHHGAYGKLRERGSFDFPQLGIAVRLDLDEQRVVDADVVLVALQARPLRIKKVGELLRASVVGEASFEAAVQAVADRAYQQCHPMPSVPGDSDYRREMVPVYVKRTILAAAGLGDAPTS